MATKQELTLSEPSQELGESLKLVRNTRGYTWEIRLRCFQDDRVDPKLIKRMEELNNEMMKTFDAAPFAESSNPRARGFSDNQFD